MAKTIPENALPNIDDFFKRNSDIRAEEKEQVIDIKLSEIDDFANHPFKVDVNNEMQEMVDSVREKGVLLPAIVRKKDNGKYEMISGHRRKKASEILKLDTIPCIVRDLTDDEATIIMVDSNLQREKILPSEKAKAYKLKMEALRHQGSRTDLTSVPVGHKLENKTSRELLSSQTGDSATSIQRYIRLTELIPKLLEMVDNEVLNLEPSIAKRTAVELSYLTLDEQEDLLNIIEYNQCTPSLSQAIALRKSSQEGLLTIEKMEELMEQSKPNQTPKLKVSMNRLSGLLPSTLRNDREREEYVINAVSFYDKYQRQRAKNQHER